MVECRRMYKKNGGPYTFCVPGPKGSITSGQQSLSNQQKSKSQAKKPSTPPPKKPSGPPPKKPRGPPKNKAGVRLPKGPPKNKAGVRLPKGPAPKKPATKPAVNKVSRKLIANRGRPTKPAPRKLGTTAGKARITQMLEDRATLEAARGRTPASRTPAPGFRRTYDDRVQNFLRTDPMIQRSIATVIILQVRKYRLRTVSVIRSGMKNGFIYLESKRLDTLKNILNKTQ